MKKVLALISFISIPAVAFADWTPLVTSDSFTGISADVQTAAAGIMAVVLVILGVAVLMRILAH